MKIIGVSAPLKSSGLRRTLDALGEILDVRFEERTVGDDAGIDAWLFPEADHEAQRQITYCKFPCYAVIQSVQLVPCGLSTTIEFSRHHILPPVLAGRRISSDGVGKMTALPCQSESLAVLASKAEAPVWAMQEVDGRQHHYVSSPIPELNEGEAIFQYFHGEEFFGLLPLFIFVRGLTWDERWEKPPLQACFMFDDPNLHWRTYGFVDFAEIAAHAQMYNYHVCFATIPLDKWFVHKPTALLFQQSRDRLSLLIHGNNHVAQELAKPYGDEGLNLDLRQALRRIDEFERHSGVEVSRVMAPPHGACNERALEQMGQLGFEAVSVSRGSLSRHNGQAPWVRTLGMKPSDIVAGLTILPRFRISRTCQNSILIAALLDQPIIPVGHHHDVADGLQLLADLSGFVNSLGKVRWADMKGISRSHYAQKLEGNILRVRMFTKRIEIRPPEGANQIVVERPWSRGTKSVPLAWKHQGDGSEWKFHRSDEPVPVLACQTIEIIAEPPAPPFIDATSVRNIRFWPVVRRQLTEARDRLAPVVRRISTFGIKSNGT